MLPLQTVAAILLGAAMSFESWCFVLPQQDPTDTLILVNKYNKAPAVPVALVLPKVDPMKEGGEANILMRPDAAAALEELFAGAAEEGMHLYAVSGYRSYSTQKAIFDRKRRERGERVANLSSAKAGYSEHQTGLAMDFEGESMLGKGLVAAIGESPEGIWVAENCWKYGFILRYPKDKTHITGYIYEPWHVRYVGKEASKEIHDLGDITFEEYILLKRGDRVQYLKEGETQDEES
ncbi:MAG: M15 family metallopeptidase [Clostridia bacterium]|nr:M15 family metallopeptidase [Clostridia bacterium]